MKVQKCVLTACMLLSLFISTTCLAVGTIVQYSAYDLTGTMSGATVATWRDMTGNGYDATQANNSNRPTYQANAINGHPALHFDSSNNTYLELARPVADDFTIAIVFQSGQGVGTGTSYYQGAGLVSGEMPSSVNDYCLALNADGKVLAGTGNPDKNLVSATGFNDNMPHFAVFRRVRANGSLTLFIDGRIEAANTGNTYSLTKPNRLVIGAQQVLNNYFTGDIAEITIYDTALSDNSIFSLSQQVREQYINGGPGKASEPEPANSSQNVSINTNLSWEAGDTAQTHRLYFGKSFPLPFIVSTSNNTYQISGLEPDSKYYWRVDQYNATAGTTGDVWSFNTTHSGDVVADGKVNITDFGMLAANWLSSCNSANGWCNSSDTNRSGQVNSSDMQDIAENWLYDSKDYPMPVAVSYNPFSFTVKDETTLEPVPMVKISTVNEIYTYTDNDGRAAFLEPGLLGKDVFFTFSSEDYEMNGDFFGYHGRTIIPSKGGSIEILLPRKEESGSLYLRERLDGSEPLYDIAGVVTCSCLGGVTAVSNAGDEGVGDYALRFDGVNDYISVPRKIADDFTISFKIKTTQTSANAVNWYNGIGLVDAEMSGFQSDFGVSMANGYILFGTGNSDYTMKSTQKVNDGKWHMVTAVREKDSGRLSIYIDSKLNKQANAGKSSLTSPSQINIGKILTGGNYFNGMMDDICILDHALSGSEVYCLYNKAAIPADESVAPFILKIIDSQTGRGVPLVQVVTDSGLEFYTDSAGVVTMVQPDLLGRHVKFTLWSHGYSGKDVTLSCEEGVLSNVSIVRNNIAERMYRITGGGIYNHSFIAGLDFPLAHPVLSGKVVGQDTVSMTEYKGKLHWLWGDTSRPSYPLGNFHTSGATSELPGAGGLEADEGIDLEYFVNNEGFSKEMFPTNEANLVWMNSLCTVSSASGERMVGSYAFLDGSASVFENGMAIFNDSQSIYQKLVVFTDNHNIKPNGSACKYDGYIYMNCPYPCIRIRPELSYMSDPTTYEAFTCLAPGTKYEDNNVTLDKDASGKLIWGWKANTSPINDQQWERMVNAGLVSHSQRWNWMTEKDNPNSHIYIACGSASYNPYRNKWVMIIGQSFGTSSFLGEIWYSEADSPEGPWTSAVKVITHDNYTMYNIYLHPELNQENGRYIYFEGTYVNTYTSNPNITPRYNYNQMMYRLDLSNPVLHQ